MVRPARRDDLDALQEIELAAGAAFRGLGMDAVADDDPPSIEVLAGFARDGRAWVVADERDAPVAYLLAMAVDGAAHLEQISVHPGSARRGLGRTLIETAAGWACEAGFSALTLCTFDQVPWNRPYYERLGFALVDDRELTPGLRELRAHERELGLDRWPRVVMRRPLATDTAGGGSLIA